MGNSETTASRRELTKSMHVVYGVAITILALVQTAVICLWANIKIPYLSALYAPVTQASVIQAPVMMQSNSSRNSESEATSSANVLHK
jgi:hypothetical protein